jgi:hypothetical protein
MINKSAFGLLGGKIIMSHEAVVSLCLPMLGCNNGRTEEEGHHPPLHASFYFISFLHLFF